MAYRLGRYAGHHTLYDELDPAVAAARRALHTPLTDEERAVQWALLKSHEEEQQRQQRREQALNQAQLEHAQLTAPKCGSQTCWCAGSRMHIPGHVYNPEPERHVFVQPESSLRGEEEPSHPTVRGCHFLFV